VDNNTAAGMEHGSVISRVEMLETRVRNTRLLCSILLLAGLVVVSAGAIRRDPQTNPDSIIVKDANGTDRIKLGLGRTGNPILQMSDRKGTLRLEMGLDEADSVFLRMNHASGTTGAVLQTSPRLGTLQFSDPNSGTWVVLETRYERGASGLQIVRPVGDGKMGVVVGSLMSKANGDSGLYVLDGNGAMCVLSLKQGNPALTLGNGSKTAYMQVRKDGAGIALTDDNGNVIYKAP